MYTHEQMACEYAPIDFSYKNLPIWWSETPRSDAAGAATIKSCHGFHKLFKRSITIPFWTSATVEVSDVDDKEFGLYYSCSDGTEIESKELTEGVKNYTGNDGISLKIYTPWKIKCNKPVEFLMTQPVWNDREFVENFTLLPGVLDFKYQNDLNVMLYTKRLKEAKRYEIKPQTALAMLVPMFEDEIEIKHILVSKEEWNNIGNFWNFIPQLSGSNIKLNHSIYQFKKSVIQKSEEYLKRK